MTGTCVRCKQEEEGELHHWAPRLVFGEVEAELWPKALLCTSCHHKWHTKMLRWALAVCEEREGVPEPLLDARTRNDYLEPMTRLGTDYD